MGLSAPQVGVNIHLMVFNPAGEPGQGEEIVLVNPRIIRYSRKIVPFNEGCLSFPGIYADVEVTFPQHFANNEQFSFLSSLSLKKNTNLDGVVIGLGDHQIVFAVS